MYFQRFWYSAEKQFCCHVLERGGENIIQNYLSEIVPSSAYFTQLQHTYSQTKKVIQS